ncbi:sigma-70 family RNA polymerase sigma factor [[Clostridium] innocuum]|nr:sigma-70 family RNA polymerase sigma factor [[Clostridium] innocuum]
MHFVIYVADEELSTALKELTEKQRNAILLRFFQGMNDREISKLYHVSCSAINSRRDRGLRKLQKLLNERE